jgi:catechol 2,3-dioxygenase-like lactoylglutathione lyase family enzyme
MEGVISDLVSRFEQGRVSRRELVRTLATLAAAGVGAASASARQQAPFTSTRIDHISIQVTDLPRSIGFYREVFGLSILNEDRENEIVRMGTDSILVSLHRKPPTGIVDHYAIAIDGFDRDAVTRALEERGLTPDQNLDYGFHVRDPEGIPVQIVGT